MADMNIVSGSFQLTTTANGANTQTVTLATQNKFVDKNVIIKFTTPEATSPSLAITDNSDAITIGAVNAGYYPLSTALTGTLTFGTPGWSGGGTAADSSVQVGTIAQSYMQLGSTTITSSTIITPTLSTTQVVTISAGYEGQRTLVVNPISSGEQAAASIVASKQASAPTLANVESLQDGKVQITANPTTAVAGINKYYFAVNADAPATNFAGTDATATVTSVGYLGEANQITIADNAIATTANSKMFYIPINSGAANVSITQNAATPTASTATGSLSGKIALTGIPTQTATDIGTYYIPFSVKAPATTFNSGSIIKTISTAGYIDNANQINVNASTNEMSSTYYMPISTGTLGAGAGSVSSNGTAGGVIISESSSVPTGYYITIYGSGAATVGTAGWLEAGTSQSSNTATKYIGLNSASMTFNGATVSASEGYVPSSGLQITLGAGSLSTTATRLESYVENTTAIVPANGYLNINAGYYENTQISLATLIPDAAGVSGSAGVGQMLAGYGAYDTNGNKIIGTIATYSGAYEIT